MNLPSKLKAGDTIGIVSPSDPITDKTVLDAGIAQLKQLGFEVKLSKNTFSNTLGYSATPQEKADDINELFKDSSVNAIFCSQGGQNSNSVLPLLYYELIVQNPKIFVGMSDITALLNGIYAKTGLTTFHGNDVMWGLGRNPKQYELDEFRRILMDGQIGSMRKNSEWKMIRKGVAEGKLLGGNLTCIGKLLGTDYLPDFTDSILFLESYGESDVPTRVSYTMHHLDQAGIFKKVKGLLLGFYKTQQSTEIEDIAKEITDKYNFPIIKCNDFGHNTPNTILPIGVKVKLDADNAMLELVENYVK